MGKDIDGTLDLSETVDVDEVFGTWTCPKCEHQNSEMSPEDTGTQVQCHICKRVFLTNPPEHAIGK